jgi:hypothetical protein
MSRTIQTARAGFLAGRVAAVLGDVFGHLGTARDRAYSVALLVGRLGQRHTQATSTLTRQRSC